MNIHYGSSAAMKSMMILFFSTLVSSLIPFIVCIPLTPLQTPKHFHPLGSSPLQTIQASPSPASSYSPHTCMHSFFHFFFSSLLQSADGDLIDCVHFAHQPAFDHPLLRNHTFQARPSSHPKEEKLGKSSTPRVTQTWRMTGSCPQETIPIRRRTDRHVGRESFEKSYGRKRHGSIPLATTITEFNPDTETGHEHAVAYVKGDEYYGGRAEINVWKPNIENPDEFSLSQMWVLGGSFSDNLNSIEAGWQVNPDLYGDNNTRLFTYWTTDSYKYTGCYNLLCSGFVQVNNNITLGGSISPLSKYHGSQYQITLQIWKDKEKGNWWLKFGKDEVMGYWPGEIFTKLKDGGGSMVEWGGEVVDMKRGLDGIHTGTQMGSGHFPREGYKMASYFSNIKVVDHSGNLKDPKHLHTFVTNHRCYSAEIDDKEESRWGHYFFYGGPGKNPDCP